MFKRLFVLFLLTVATASASTPAHASTLAVNSLGCWNYGDGWAWGVGSIRCSAWISGGTGTYTSYVWGVRPVWGYTYSYETTTEPRYHFYCDTGYSFAVKLTVTDSAGATASSETAVRCENLAD